MRFNRLKVAHIRHLNKGYVLLTLAYDNGMEIPVPGQFFMLKPSSTLIARPISVHNFFYILKKGYVEFLFKVVGKGTSELSRVKKGDYVTLWGPIGNRFPIPENGRSAILVAGGRGIAPLFFLATRLFEKGYDIYLFYGVRESDEFVHLLRLKNLCKRLFLTSEDGKKGRKGVITDLFQESIGVYFREERQNQLLFDINGYNEPICYVCGPDIMIDKVCEISLKKKIRTYVSMESHLACGTGVCLGCTIESKGGKIFHICKDGPVFDAEELFCR